MTDQLHPPQASTLGLLRLVGVKAAEGIVGGLSVSVGRGARGQAGERHERKLEHVGIRLIRGSAAIQLSFQ